MIKKIIPGLRIIKTALSVLICLQFFYIFDYHEPIYAVLACILTMKETSFKTKTHGQNRILGTLIGGVMSYLCLLTISFFNLEIVSGWIPLFISTFLLMTLTICKWFRFDPYVFTIAAIVTTVTILASGNSKLDAFIYVSTRTLETMIGFIIAYLINQYLLNNRIISYFSK